MWYCILPGDIQIKFFHGHQKLLAKLYFIIGWPKISTNHLFCDDICYSILNWYYRLHTFVAKKYKQIHKIGVKTWEKKIIGCTYDFVKKSKVIKNLFLNIYIRRLTNLNSKGL